jgi:serine-protein kinase ATM
MDLLYVCRGNKRGSSKQNSFAVCGPVFQAALLYQSTEPFSKYLLLLEDEESANPIGSYKDQIIPNHSLSVLRVQEVDYIILNQCIQQLEITERTLRELVTDRPQHIIPETVRAVTTMVVLSTIICGIIAPSDRLNRLLKSCQMRKDTLQQLLTDFISTRTCATPIVDAMLATISPTLMRSLSSTEVSLASSEYITICSLASKFATAIEARESTSNSLSSENDDAMDLDNEFETQVSNGRADNMDLDLPRTDLAAGSSLQAFRASTKALLCLLASSKGSKEQGETTLYLNGYFVDHLLSLSPSELLACRPLFNRLFRSGIDISRDDAGRFFEKMAEIIQSNEYERCEVALAFCTELWAAFITLWTDGDDELSEVGGAMYNWFVTLGLESGILSSRVQIGLARLLENMLSLCPTFLQEKSSASVRTNLFSVLKKGDILVKFHFADRIASIFGSFPLKDHEEIFDQVERILPMESDWPEGISMRLLLLSRLASSWNTLLRRSVYRVFETCAGVETSTPHASRCVLQVSIALKLMGPRELWKLFAKQLLYTWFQQENSLQDIPYSMFGYYNVSEMLRDVSSEAAGQLMMIQDESAISQLGSLLDTSVEELIKRSFSKVLGYGIARDVSIPPPSSDGSPLKYVNVDSRVRQILGTDTFARYLKMHFASVIAMFFTSMEDEDQLVRKFAKIENYENASIALQEMRGSNATAIALPGNQQPTFKARYLVDQLHYLCKRSKLQTDQVWSPSIFVFVLRELLNTIQPALGSLHACAVLRRVQILLSMSGTVSYSGYGLEMLLHSMRPFLKDRQCSTDAISIMKYVLERATNYLAEVPSFVAGISLSVLASLRVFLSSEQDSTTEESQFRATVTSAEGFHIWFGELLEQYDSRNMSIEDRSSFSRIAHAALAIRGHGTAEKDTSEAELLLALLEDENRISPLLDDSSRQLAFSLLCSNFRQPQSYHDDILGTDKDADSLVTAVWKSCQLTHVSDSYRLWAARVLGRAYASTGRIHTELVRESQVELLTDAVFEKSLGGIASKVGTLKAIRNLLFSDNGSDVAVAEASLREIIYRTKRTQDEQDQLVCHEVLPGELINALSWDSLPPTVFNSSKSYSLENLKIFDPAMSVRSWVQLLSISLSSIASKDAIMSSLPGLLTVVHELAERIFPYIVHIILLRSLESPDHTRESISSILNSCLSCADEVATPHARMAINTLLYLRTQPLPQESVKSDRERWLEIDYRRAAEAAIRCKMFKTAILFLEIQSSQVAAASKRASMHAKIADPTALLQAIFRNLEDPDSFYGVLEQSSLLAVTNRLDYEKAGFKGLLFHGAQYDSLIRANQNLGERNTDGLINAFSTLNLNGLSLSLLGNGNSEWNSSESFDTLYQSARRLEQWDIPAPPELRSESVTIYRAFQCINRSTDASTISHGLDSGLLLTMNSISEDKQTAPSLHSALRTLASLTEIDETIHSGSSGNLQESWNRLKSRNSWMESGQYEDVGQLLSVRETLFSSLALRPHLGEIVHATPASSLLFQARALLESSRLGRLHSAPTPLATATHLSNLVAPCADNGLDIGVAAQFEVANVLWDQDEMVASTRMLQSLQDPAKFRKQDITVPRSVVLAKLGHQISEARLEKPDEIVSLYLLPAVKALKDAVGSTEAGQVYHEFASFCDRQLQNPENLEDFRRIQKLRQRKEAEVNELAKMMKAAPSQNRDILRSHHAKAKMWFDLDDRDYQRLRNGRQVFLVRSLENYLLALQSCEAYNSDVLRFFTLWLQQSGNELANTAVEANIGDVASRKFAPLINQLSSRLLDSNDHFQIILFEIVSRICVDHPYHGMYHLFAGIKTKGSRDEKALSRFAAATKIVSRISAGDSNAASIWTSVHNAGVSYVRLAGEKLGEGIKQGAKVSLRKSKYGHKLETDIPSYKIPSPTMSIELRADCDYESVPIIVKFLPEMSIAGGISAPKIITAVTSDGSRSRQLVSLAKSFTSRDLELR